MNKTKIKNFALLFTLILFIVSLALSVVTVFRAHADDPVADVSVEISTHEDLAPTTDNNIYGKENVKAVGWTGWGGFHKGITLSQAYDVSAIANSGKGALSFWLYIPDATVLGLYTSRSASQGFNIDVSSHTSYVDATASTADTVKWTFHLSNEQFKDMRVGWQRIVMPFSAVAAGDKSNIDWANVQSMRINAEGMGLGGGYTGKVADISFTTTNLTKNTITGDPVTTFGFTSVAGDIGSAEVSTKREIADLGETVDAWGRFNEGGHTSTFTLDKTYSVTKTDSTALSFWVYFESDSDCKKYSNWNISFSSGDSYSDAHKYEFNLRNVYKDGKREEADRFDAFARCKAGWNNIIIPLEAAEQKPDMDWSSIKFMRIGCNGGSATGFYHAKHELIQTNYTETTVVGYVAPDPGEEKPDPTVTFTEEGGIVSFSDNVDGLATDKSSSTLAGIKQLDAQTEASYVLGNMNGNWSTWGGMVRQTVFDKPYNVGAISTNEKGAFVFWLYIHNQGTLEKIKSGSGFGINMSSGEAINESQKWEFSVTSLANDMMLGWNKIIIPFSSSLCQKRGGGPATANTVQNLRFVVLDGAGGGVADVAFADFGFFLTDETQACVINQKTQMVKPDDVTFNVGNASDLTADTTLLTGKTAYSAIGKNWGAKTQLITFDKAYDLSNHNLYGKSVLSLAMYFADEATLEAHRAITEGYTVTLGSGSEFNAANAYQFDIAPQFADCSVGWNTINLPVDTADNKGGIDWANVKFLQIAWNKAFGEGECEVAFAQFRLISTDETARSVENDSGISLSISQVEELAKVTLIRSKKNVTSYSTIGKGWGRIGEKKFTLAKSYDTTKFESNGAFAFWLYIENEATLNAHKAVAAGGWFIRLYSGDYKGATKLTFDLQPVFANCIVGWNKIVLPFTTGTDSNLNFGAVSSFSIDQDKATAIAEPNQNQIALAEFSIVATELTKMTVTETVSNVEEGLNPVAEKVIIDCNSTNGLMFAGNKVDTQDCRYESGCVYTSGAGYALPAQFEGGETDLRKSTIILAFWLWIEDPAYFFEADGTTLKSGINGQIELASAQAWDTNEINWELRQWGLDKMQKGWNWIVLKGADGNISGGDPNFDALVRFRIYVNGIQQSTLKIDRITIGADEKLLTAPDWEKEIFGKDPGTGFKGPNAYMPANDPYIEVDFDNGAKDFTTLVTVKETVKVTRTEEGCSSSLTAVPVAFTVLIGAAAISILVVGKKKNNGK